MKKIIGKYGVVVAWLFTCSVTGCGRGNEAEEAERGPQEVEEAIRPGEEISLIKITPQSMLSRRGDGAGVPEKTVTKPDRADVPIETKNTASSLDPKSSPASRIVYRYIQPLEMLSDKDPGVELQVGNIEEISSGESRLSDMAALAYVLGPFTNRADNKAARPVSGPGFLYEEDLFPVEDTLGSSHTGKVSDDPDAVQKAVFYIHEAEKKLSEDRLEEAESLYAEALLIFPETIYVNRRLGHISMRRGEYSKAVSFFTAALDSGENMAESLNELGIAYLYAGRPQEALQNFEAASRADSDMVEPVYNAGLALRQLNRIEAAREKINEFLEFEPANARGYRELGMLSLIESNRAGAISMLERAMLLDHTWGMPYLDAATIFAEMTEYEKALSMLDDALEFAPAISVYRAYSAPAFSDLRLMPESRPFESRLTAALRKTL